MNKVIIFLFVSLPMILSAQMDHHSELFITLLQKDSLIFNLGFNECDISQFEQLMSEKAEFFHDQSGVLHSKSEFINNIKEGICKMENKPRRELVAESVEVYPLKNRGVLYGALQMGEHKFFIRPDGKEEVMTSIAKFTHLWLLEEEEWLLAKIYSFDHQAP